MPKVDKETWDTIKAEFIRTNCTFQRLADKYGVSRQNINKRCMKEGWHQIREEWQAKVKQTAEEKMVDEDSDRIVKRMQVLDLFMDKIQTALDHYDAENDNSSIKQLTSAMKDVLDMQATTAGRATQQIEVVFSAGEDSWNE